MRQLHLSRSIVFPLTLKIVLATVLLSALAFFAVYHTLANESEAAIVRVIDTDIVGLADSYAAEGLSGISRRITDRLALSPEQGEQPLYSLVDAQGHALVGNVAKWPLIDARSSEVARVVIAGQPPALSRATILRGGLKLLVGRSTTNRDARLRAAAQIFSGALVLIALVAVAFGFATAFTLRSRIAQINSVFQAVERGNLAARAPLARSGDEIAQLGGKVNHMLFRVESLMAAQRDVTDHTAHETRTPLTLLDAELRIRDGVEHSFYAQFNKIDSLQEVVVVYLGNNAVDCGAINLMPNELLK